MVDHSLNVTATKDGEDLRLNLDSRKRHSSPSISSTTRELCLFTWHTVKEARYSERHGGICMVQVKKGEKVLVVPCVILHCDCKTMKDRMVSIQTQGGPKGSVFLPFLSGS